MICLLPSTAFPTVHTASPSTYFRSCPNKGWVGTIGGALPRGSDFPQSAGRAGISVTLASRKKIQTVPEGRPLQASLTARKLLPLALEGCLFCLPVNHQTALGLWPLYVQECLAALAWLRILIFQSDESSLSPSCFCTLLEKGRARILTLRGTNAVKKIISLQMRLKAHGRSLSPGPEPRAACQVHE